MMRVPRSLVRFGALLLGAWLLAGCAGPRAVDVDVTAYSRWPTVTPGASTYFRFERLPSQANDPQNTQLEAVASGALARKGLQWRPELASYGVQLNFSNQMVAGSAFGGPTIGIGTGVISGGSGGFSSAGIGFGFPIGGAAPGESRTELVLLVRNLRSNEVVYETRAYAQAAAGSELRAAMLEAALRDFPVSTAGTLRTRVALPSP